MFAGISSAIDPQELIRTLGTLGLIAIIFAESGLLLGIIFPGDSLLFTATGKFGLNIWAVAGGAFVAAVAGAQVGFWIGKKYGPRLFQRPDSRIFKAEYVERSRVFFDKHGSKAIVLARFVPFVRTLAPPMAGMGQMDTRTFTLFNIVGAAIWALGVTLLGYFAGDLIPSDKVDTYRHLADPAPARVPQAQAGEHPPVDRRRGRGPRGGAPPRLRGLRPHPSKR
jgi:membrane-associated protein